MHKNIILYLFVINNSLLFSTNAISEHALSTLSEYGFFEDPINKQIPKENVIPYTISSQLFTDYAEKLRFIKVPENLIISHNKDLTFNYPEGTFLIKTFFYLNDMNDSKSQRRLIETRLLKKVSSEWIALPYIWNNNQTDAILSLAGNRTDVSWINLDGRNINISYSIPNMNQCKSCHVYNNILQPIGPKVRNLNLIFSYKHGSINQIEEWVSLGILEPFVNQFSLPKTVDYMDIHNGSINDRARAWLDINCAHCHRVGGPAETSGLYLDLEESNPTALGIYKPPVAAGRGSGNRKYNIVPGHPEESILQFRITSIDPAIMMPELNRKLVHKEGVELIQAWIKEMDVKE